jgi:ribose 5-phosphate isomerase B
MTKSIAVGSDGAGAKLRHAVIDYLQAEGYETDDYGVDTTARAYPSVAFDVAQAVRNGSHDRAILCCGTGIGMAIAANKVPGVYAANCHDVYSAQRARKSNAAQILTMGEKVVGIELALLIVEAWLGSEFQGGGSSAKVAAIAEFERGGALAKVAK